MSYQVRNFTVKDNEDKILAENVPVSASAEDVYFAIGDAEGNTEITLKEMVFGDNIPSSNAKNLHGRIEILENKKIDITSIPTSVIENKIKNDINNKNLSNGAVLTYEGFKKMQDLEAKSCKSESALAIAEGKNNVAGKLGLTINHILKQINQDTGETTYTLVCGKGLNQINNDTILELYRNIKEYQGYIYCNIQWNYCFNNIKTEIYYGNDLLLQLNRYIFNSAVYPLRLTFTEDNFPTYLKNLATEQEEEIVLNENTPFPNGVVYLYVYKNNDTTQPVCFMTIPSGADIGLNARAFGQKNTVLGANSFASGYGNIVYGANSFAMGVDNQVDYCSYADGRECIARGKYAHAEGRSTIAGTIKTDVAHAEGNSTQALGESSHAEGHSSKALGTYSHAEGQSTEVTGAAAHVEGFESKINESQILNRKITSTGAHAEGFQCIAQGNGVHAEGYQCKAYEMGSHAEGYKTIAGVLGAQGNIWGIGYAHAEGEETQALGYGSHAEGKGTIAYQDHQHVQGKYNEQKTDNYYAHIVGWGSSNSDRKNIHTLTTTGDAWFAGDVSAKSFTLNGNTITDWPTGGGSDYELPIAGEGLLGGVKIGNGLNITDDGVLSVISSAVVDIPAATADTLGGIKISFNDGILTITT